MDKGLFILKRLIPPLGEKLEANQAMGEKEWNLLDCKAFGAIRLTLSELIAINMKNNNTVSSLIVVLTSLYKQSFVINKVNLIKKLFNLKILENNNFK